MKRGRKLPIVVFCLCVCAALFGRAEAGAIPHRAALANVAPATQARISAVLGRDDAVYAVTPGAGDYRLYNPAHQFTAEFDGSGVRLTVASRTWEWALAGYGYDETLQNVTPARVQVAANRVEYQRGAMTEWYVNGPLGLEQGFTLERPPAAERTGALTLGLALGGDLNARVQPDGQSLELFGDDGALILRYTGLTAYDAAGRELSAWLELDSSRSGTRPGSELYIRVQDDGAVYPIVIDPFVQQAILTASNGGANDKFGFSVASSGNTVVVAAPYHTVSTNAEQGIVYVFVQSTWTGNLTENARLTASDGAAYDDFGFSVAVNGNTIVVGAPQHKVGVRHWQGQAYVFTQSTWSGDLTESARLTASDGAADDAFGYSVGVSGNTVVVGALDHKVGTNVEQGRAYVYTQSTWTGNLTENARLTASDGLDGDHFGNNVAINGNTIVVGACTRRQGTNMAQGQAYVFVQTTWSGDLAENARLTASDGADNDWFGSFVAISGNTIVVSSPDRTMAGHLGQGQVYVFVQTTWSGNLTENARLKASDGAVYDYFGANVAVSGNTVVVGAPQHDISGKLNQGQVYVFENATWSGDLTETAKLTASDGVAFSEFGNAVAISGNRIVAGASIHTVGSNYEQGQAYVFAPSGTTPSTTTTITSHSPHPSTVGEAVTVGYTVTSSGGTPTGNVTVSDGKDTCTGTVAAGSCTLTLTTLGTRTLTATFAGDSQFSGSVSTGVPHTVSATVYRLHLPLIIR